MLAILLSHHRTGSTAIQRALANRMRVCPDEPLLFSLTIASPYGEDFAPTPLVWPAFLKWCVSRYDLIHCHRDHVHSLNGWEPIAEHGAKIIHLTRQHKLHQVLSYKRALADGVWHDHQRGHSHGDPIEFDAFSREVGWFATLEAYAEFYFRDLPALHVSYEEFAREPFPTIERIARFILEPGA